MLVKGQLILMSGIPGEVGTEPERKPAPDVGDSLSFLAPVKGSTAAS